MPNYSPQEDANTLFLERTFMLSAFIYNVGYGVQIVMYFNCASYFWEQRNDQGKHAFFRLTYTTVLFILESLVIAAALWILVSMYIDDRDYPGGPMVYFLVEMQQPPGATVVGSLFALSFMSDLLVLWRCWVIWSPTGKLAAYAVICAPVLFLLSSLVLGIMWGYQSNHSGSSLYSRLSLHVGTAYYVTSLCVNLLVTILIITRLLLYRRTVSKTLPADHTKHYLSVATIVIESALLYSIFALAFVITYALDNPMNQVFMYMASACQQIAGYMIILRVAQRRAWTSNTLALSTVSTNIRFNPPLPISQGAIELCHDRPRDRDSTTIVEKKLDVGDSV